MRTFFLYIPHKANNTNIKWAKFGELALKWIS